MRKRFWIGMLVVGLAALIAVNTDGAERGTVGRTTVRAADGVNIVCESRGKAETTLLFLHGWCGTRQWWTNQVDEFARDYRWWRSTRRATVNRGRPARNGQSTVCRRMWHKWSRNSG